MFTKAVWWKVTFKDGTVRNVRAREAQFARLHARLSMEQADSEIESVVILSDNLYQCGSTQIQNSVPPVGQYWLP